VPPTALIESIDAVRRRARWLSVAYGVGIVIGAALTLLLLIVALDYLLNLYAWPRVVAMTAAVVAVAWCVYRYVARPATVGMSLSDIAGRLERAFPQFEDRLRSTINFVEGNNPGSAVLQQRTIDQTTRIASQIDLGRAVVAKPAVVSLGSALAAAIIVLLLAGLLLDRSTLGLIASRLVTPFSASPWPKRVQIDWVGQPPTRVAVGQKIDVLAMLRRGDQPSIKPILYYQIDGGPVQQVFMSRGADNGFASSLDARLEPGQAGGTMRVWMEAGDDRRELAPIQIVPRLAIRKIVARVTPPAYAVGRPTQTVELANAPAVAAEGSGVSVEVTFNKPLNGRDKSYAAGTRTTDPTLQRVGAPTSQPTEPLAADWSRPSEAVAVATFVADASRRFRVHAVDADGFANTALEEYEVVVRPDTNLAIQLENPRRSEERTPTAFVPLQAVVEDDCGIAEMVLVVERLQPSPRKWELPLLTGGKPTVDVSWQPVDASSDRVRFRANYKWELNPLQLVAGDVIEYSVVARDNYDLGGKRHDPVGTPKLRITLVSQDELAGRVTDELRSVKTQATLVRTTQQRAKQETQQLETDTKDKPQLDAGDQDVAQRLTQQQASAAAAAKQLGDRVQQSIARLEENRSTAEELKQTADDVRNTLVQTGEGAMKNAAAALANAGEKDRAAEPRQADLSAAQQEQQKALNQLDRAMAKLDTVGSLQASVGEINAILAEQRQLRQANEAIAKTNLGKKAEDLNADDKAKLDNVVDRQNKLAERTQKALDQMSKQAEQMKRSDPSSADAMAAAAKQGEQSKVAPDQKRAAQQSQQNQQANAQQTQKQVELGLEQVLGELKEAQKRELARLRDQLAQLQEQVATLVRRQSGHNLDSLLLQGPEKLKSVDPKQIATLTEDARRKPDQIQPPEPRLLTTAQELTARNARDLAGTTDGQAQTAELGSRLGRAAGQMERAIVGLRAAKIAEAYDPHQIEALAALQEAKALVNQQKEEADKKQQEQQKDAIRERYVKIKARQQQINADTVKVEKARDEAGNVRRTEWPTLARLPKTQAELAEETAKIEEDLSTLGSIVYVWANRDIKNAMDAVGADLVASKTAVPTQAEQERIVEELTAMIKHLEEKPPEQKFENAGAGGGQGGAGGQQPPKMPTEPELKLLKSLQSAVNTSTGKIAAEPKPDGERLTSLGNRQGELRNLLDSLLKKASQGQGGLSAEPDNKDQLPEEAAAADVEQKDLEDTLLGDDPAKKQEKIDKDFKLVGTRMARSRQRLAINTDPGPVTQEIQRRILTDLDDLIDQALKNSQQQQQQSASSGSGKPGQPNQPGDPQAAGNQGQNKPGQGQQNGNAQQGSADQNAAAGSPPKDLKDLTETASEWGSVTPRVRQAVIDSRSESIVEQYRKIIEDYYGALGNQGGKKR
jgi:hypothetical protein